MVLGIGCGCCVWDQTIKAGPTTLDGSAGMSWIWGSWLNDDTASAKKIILINTVVSRLTFLLRKTKLGR
jgi:hypothetical protein